jgi:hypothetical protein
MAKRSSEAALRAQKERKQKIFVVAGLVVFLALMAWQGPKTLKALRGGSPPPPAVQATALPLPTGTTSTPSGTETGLPESDVQPDLLDGQLLSFSRFGGRDPFVPLAPPGALDSAPADDAATVEVNGTSESLSVGDQFPASDPTFRLVSVTASSVQVGLVSGAFSDGAETITIGVGQTLVLMADDGARYSVKLVSVAVT